LCLIYDVLTPHTQEVDYSSTLENREAVANKLDESLRALVGREHPALSARLHELHQNIIWDKVIMGEDKPFGTVTEYWRRLEFQARGYPHTHNLVWVESQGINKDAVTDKNPEINGKVKELVAATTTAYLLPPVNNNVNGRANELTNELEQHWKFNVRLGTRIDLSYCP
jgi:hypothetical protein